MMLIIGKPRISPQSTVHKESGWLLLESLLAVVILSAGLTLILRAIYASYRSVVENASYCSALYFFENKMDLFLWQQFLDIPDDLLSKKEASREGAPSYVLNMHEALGSDSPDGLKELHLSVSWKSGRKDHELSLTTYLLDSGESYERFLNEERIHPD